MKVHISGSIGRRHSLGENELPALEQIVDGRRTVLVGDALGLDRLVQKYLAIERLKSVIVYHSGKAARNNFGNWPTRQVADPYKAMADDCDSAIFFWEDDNEQTQRNIDYLNGLGKYHLVCGNGGLSIGNFEKINNMIML